VGGFRAVPLALVALTAWDDQVKSVKTLVQRSGVFVRQL
jgi:hypothetical protein